MPTDLTTIPRSATAYSGVNLRLYDAFVLHFTSPCAWGCSLSDLTEMYRRHGPTTTPRSASGRAAS